VKLESLQQGIEARLAEERRRADSADAERAVVDSVLVKERARADAAELARSVSEKAWSAELRDVRAQLSSREAELLANLRSAKEELIEAQRQLSRESEAATLLRDEISAAKSAASSLHDELAAAKAARESAEAQMSKAEATAASAEAAAASAGAANERKRLESGQVWTDAPLSPKPLPHINRFISVLPSTIPGVIGCALTFLS
jgi:chromosome segregation ATPase